MFTELVVNAALELHGTMVPERGENENGDDEGSLARPDLIVEDEKQQTETLAALDTMRKNRHFCDVVLNVSISFCVFLHRALTRYILFVITYLHVIIDSTVVNLCTHSFRNVFDVLKRIHS
jgi:hypothetical protein